jgi:hypothetical protein
MTRSWLRAISALMLVLGASTLAFAQASGGTTTLSGTVVDADGGFVPGATVDVKNNATGQVISVVSNTSGAFSVPALDPGTYTVTVSLQGFKTAVFNDVRLLAAQPQSLKAVLEVGALTETIEVRGGTELVNTTTATVSSTMSVEQISNLPLSSRNALNAVSFLPGVETNYSAGDNVRDSTIMGLPQNTINITLDGVSVGNNLQSGDGFFSMITPRLDAVEEVTVTGAVPGADRGGQGAVNVAFVTRSGSNTFDRSIYHYMRHPALNSNYFFNEVNGLDKNDVNVHQYGGRIGGPIVLPGLFDGRGRAFFFFNYEHFYQPTEATRTRTIINEQAQQGLFAYNVTSGGVTTRRQVNLFGLSGLTPEMQATMDPTIAALLTSIRAAAQTTGNITTPPTATNTQSYIYQSPSTRNEWAPTTRLDFNLTPRHRLTGSYYWQRFHSNPDILNDSDAAFPGFPNYGIQASYRTTGSVTLRSTLGQNLVNELKGGWQWSPIEFNSNVHPGMFDNMGGYAITLGFGLTSLVSNSTGTNSISPRNTVNWNIDNNLSWLKGAHSVNLGFSFTQLSHDQHGSNAVPTLGLGVDNTNDPARTLFNQTNFPGASNTDLNNARALFALLTGRVTSVGGTGRLDTTGRYVYLGDLNTKSRMNEIGAFIQDSWRLTPTFTLNAGARYEVMLPFTPLTGNFTTATLADLCGVSGVGSGPGGRQCNLFQPGNLAGADVTPQFVAYEVGRAGFETDWNNIAPNIGAAWRPNVQDGWLRALLGDPEQATLRAGYAVAFNRERMDRFTNLFGGNPGDTTPATRNVNNGNLVSAGESWPLLLRDRDRLGPPPNCPEGTVSAACMQATPNYPIVATVANDVNIFAPDLRLPYTESWNIGWQRALGRDMAFEIRYVGNRNKLAWTTENWNALNIFENGFLDEFKLAQANLAAHVAQGCGQPGAPACSFAYRGPGTGTAPLPTYLAYFSARSNAADPAAYTSGLFSDSAWTGHLGYYEPDPFDAANDLHANATRRANAIAAGLPANHFVMNPVIDDANITRAAAGSRYHSVQFDLRRRLTRGLTATFNYTYARRWGSSLQDLHFDRFYLESANVPHALKWTWLWEVPVGRGRRFGTDMHPILNGVIGNWEFSGTGRHQWRQFALSEVRVVGMSIDELQDAFKIRIVRDPETGTTTVFSMPQDILENTRRAFNTSPTSPTGYGADGPPTGRYLAPVSDQNCLSLFAGDCGVARQLLIMAPPFTRLDLRFKKKFPFGRRANFELDFEVLNAFDNVNFNYAFNPGGGNGVFLVDDAYTDINTTYDPGGRIGQIVWRINW